MALSAMALSALFCSGARAQEAGAVALPSVIVQGQRPQPPPSLSTLDAGALSLTQATHISEAMTRVPGAWISRGSGQEHLSALRSPVLSGAGACGEFLFLEDGVPIRPAGFCNVNQLFEIDTEHAGAIEVLRGPHTVLYGSNALHGAINVQTPVAASASYALRYGSEDFRELSVVAPVEKWTVTGLATRSGSFRDDEAYDQYKLKLRYAGESQVTQLSATRLQQETAGFILGQDAYRDATLRTQNLNPEAYRDADALRFLHRRSLAGIEATAFARHSRMDFIQHFLPGKPLEENGQDSAGLILRHEGDSRFLGMDLEFARGELIETQALAITSGSAFNQATRPAGRHYDYRVAAVMAALYGQQQWPLAGGTVTAGLRGEYLHYNYATRLAPGNAREDGGACAMGGCLFNRPASRADEFLNLAPKLEYARCWGAGVASLVLARGFRAPQATELYRLQRGQDVADLRSTLLDSIEAGWRGGDAALHYSLSAYLMRKTHVILRDAEGFNVSDGATRHQGIEVGMDRAWQNWNFALAASYALHRYDFSRNAEQGESISAGSVIDTAPRTLGSARIGRRWASGRSELEWTHLGEYTLDARGSAAYPGHNLLNLYLQQSLAAGFSVNLALRNLLDRPYAERADIAFEQYRYFPGSERSFTLGVAWQAAKT